MVPCYIQSCSSSVLSVTRALRGLRVAPLAFGVAVDARTELPLPKETKNKKSKTTEKNKILHFICWGGKKGIWKPKDDPKNVLYLMFMTKKHLFYCGIAERMSGGVAVVSESITSLLVLNPRDKRLSAVSQIVHQLALTLFLDSQIDKTYGTPQN